MILYNINNSVGTISAKVVNFYRDSIVTFRLSQVNFVTLTEVARGVPNDVDGVFYFQYGTMK